MSGSDVARVLISRADRLAGATPLRPLRGDRRARRRRGRRDAGRRDGCEHRGHRRRGERRRARDGARWSADRRGRHRVRHGLLQPAHDRRVGARPGRQRAAARPAGADRRAPAARGAAVGAPWRGLSRGVARRGSSGPAKHGRQWRRPRRAVRSEIGRRANAGPPPDPRRAARCGGHGQRCGHRRCGGPGAAVRRAVRTRARVRLPGSAGTRRRSGQSGSPGW